MGKKWTMFLLVALLISGIPCASYAAKFKLMDIDLDLSGSVRLDMGYKFSDLGSTPTAPAGQESRQTDWFVQVPNNSRLGLRTTYENIGAYYEIGFNTRNNPSTNTNLVSTRYLYATYNFNSSNSLLLGQTKSLLAPLDPEQHLNNDQQMKGFGNLDPGRNPQFKYSYVNGGLTASIALEDTMNACADSIVSGSHIVDNYVPVVQASLIYQNDMFMIMPSVYYQTYTLKKNDAESTTKTIEIGSWAAALDGTLNTDIILLAMEIWYGQNLSTYGIDFRSSTAKQSTTMGAPVANSEGSDIKDVNSVGGWLQVGIPVKPVTIYLGYGFQQSEVKNTDTATVQYENSIMTQSTFVNAKWEIKRNFFIQPEVAYFDNGNDAQKTLNKPTGSVYSAGDNKLDNNVLAGVHFQYDF